VDAIHETVVAARDEVQHSLPERGTAADSLHTPFIAAWGYRPVKSAKNIG
jgi:hypothetical protein